MSINAGKLLKKTKHLNLLTDEKTLEREIETSELARPGLSLIRESDLFPYSRVQVYGLLEIEYLDKFIQTEDQIKEILNVQTPIVIFAHDYVPTETFLKVANERNIAIFNSKHNTTKIISDSHRFLNYELAPNTRVHGVLLSIFGVGVLIKGASGVGKSEVALELVKNGHFLIADDAVEIKQLDDYDLVGTSPDILKSRLEIRGIGIVNIQQLYGITSVLPEQKVDIIIELRTDHNQIDRIGNAWKSEKILGVSLTKIELPVYAGRSIANMIETAVANYQLKFNYGYDSSAEFIEDLNRSLIAKKE